jgi:hypothetical protein
LKLLKTGDLSSRLEHFGIIVKKFDNAFLTEVILFKKMIDESLILIYI